MATTINKVDMSLDDIIKMDRKKTQKIFGKDPKLKGRGFRKGGFQPGGQSQTGRGGRGRGRGARRLQRLSLGVSPLNRTQAQGTSTASQGAISLAEKRKKAIEALQKAKQRVALLTQQQNRQSLVNQRRGIQTTTNQRTNTGGQRGRGRGFLNRSYGSQQNLFQYQNDIPFLNRGGQGRGRGQGRGWGLVTGQGRGRGQGQDRTQLKRSQSFDIRTESNGHLTTGGGQTNVGRRQRRKMNRSFESDRSSQDGIFTISVNNPTPRKQTKRSKLQRQIQNLKPTVSTNYKFNPGFFANAGVLSITI
ncbi:uncharacterized protein LOC121374299 isoform X2 [Gigantopelta aegis]|uniref:uncharacterized protein LOC121374299 isoform X2 n=1 Tax=Gigantopelta aegis TaxID=1735272 RepID=UPI001B887C5B|nr:uncharacterized protein LOC121374299 isoform X2 [Gigantopelta aegis]